MAWIDIYDRNGTYGYAAATWEAVKNAARTRIVSNLRNDAIVLTTYGDLERELRPVIDSGSPRNPVFHCLLGQLSDEQEEVGRGLLTALVVRADDYKPGSGFFEGAASWGRDVSDQERCWTAEIEKLKRVWASN